jgi:hypothetical protein
LYNNVLYYTKGSGSNGVNTVYFVDTTGTACPNGTGLPKPAAQAADLLGPHLQHERRGARPDGLNPGLTPATCASSRASRPRSGEERHRRERYPFGLWFANPTRCTWPMRAPATTPTPATNTYTAAAASTTAGLQKWVYDPAARQWKLAYTLQTGLNLGTPYNVAGYPTGDNGPGGTGLPWAPATDGLRNLTGQVNPNGTVSIWAVTSTVSGGGDQGADPNQLVRSPTCSRRLVSFRGGGRKLWPSPWTVSTRLWAPNLCTRNKI